MNTAPLKLLHITVFVCGLVCTSIVNAESNESNDSESTDGKIRTTATESADDGNQSNTARLTQKHNHDKTTVNVVVDRASIGVAEKLLYTLTVETESDASVEFEAVNETFGQFKVVEYNPFGPIKMTGKRLRWQREYTLIADIAGVLTIPSLTIKFYPPQAKCVTADDCEMTAHGRRADRRIPKSADYKIATDSITIEVKTVLSADADLTRPRDVQPPIVMAAIISDSGNSLNAVWIIALVLAASMLALAWHRRRTEPQHAVEPVVTETPQQQALDALMELKARQLPSRGEHETYFERLSLIFRDYTSRAFGISALKQTTDELMRAVDRHPELTTQRAAIKRILTTSDLAKFAHHYPDTNTSEAMLDELRQVVENSNEDD